MEVITSKRGFGRMVTASMRIEGFRHVPAAAPPALDLLEERLAEMLVVFGHALESIVARKAGPERI
jgi:hypothetical protein